VVANKIRYNIQNMRPSIIKTDGTSIDYAPQNGTDFTLEELQKAVGGYIEIIQISSTQIMVLNEEGKLKGLPFNRNASLIFAMAGIRQVAVGDVVVCGTEMVK